MNKDKIKGALLGALAGLITGVLVAPKSGKETRQDIKGTLGKLKDDISEKLSGLGAVTKDSYDNVINEVVDSYERDKKLSKEDAAEVKKALDAGFDNIKDKLKEK